MKVMILFCSAMLLTMTAAGPSDAKGCIKGAIVGGVAGHYAGHHGFLGAAAGCLVGRHQAAQRQKENARQQETTGQAGNNPDRH